MRNRCEARIGGEAVDLVEAAVRRAGSVGDEEDRHLAGGKGLYRGQRSGAVIGEPDVVLASLFITSLFVASLFFAVSLLCNRSKADIARRGFDAQDARRRQGGLHQDTDFAGPNACGGIMIFGIRIMAFHADKIIASR